MKTDTFALMTPAGTRIVGTVDTIPASAAVSGFYEDDDGRLIAEYVGDTNVYWDCQETAEACGQPILMDENGAEWLERECLRVPIGADGEPLSETPDAHTPGPWKVDDGGDGEIEIWSEERRGHSMAYRSAGADVSPSIRGTYGSDAIALIAPAAPLEATEEDRANARLIAAAPAMKRRLHDIYDICGWYERGEIDPEEALNQIGKLSDLNRV